MDLATIIGLLIGTVGLVIAFLMEGGTIGSLLGVTAAIIVFGGTFGALMVGSSLEDIKKLPSLFRMTLQTPPDRRVWLVQELVTLAEVARRDGLLALENRDTSDPFLQRALMLVVDGTDPQTTREIMERDIEAMADRHARGQAMFTAMGGYAPTLGIMGAVMGLIHVLSSLDNPDELGPAIAVAFIATLYGVGSANLIWLPIASKLKLRSAHEIEERMLILDGALALQAGDNPRVLRQKLLASLPPELRDAEPEAAGAGAMAFADGGE